MFSTESIITDATFAEMTVAGPTVTLSTVGNVVVAELLTAVRTGRCMLLTVHLAAGCTRLLVIRTDHLLASLTF